MSHAPSKLHQDSVPSVRRGDAISLERHPLRRWDISNELFDLNSFLMILDMPASDAKHFGQRGLVRTSNCYNLNQKDLGRIQVTKK